VSPFKLFLLSLVLLALLATLYSTPKTIELTYTTLADDGSEGHSILYAILSRSHPVVTNAAELPPGRPVVAVVAEPSACSASALEELLAQLQQHQGRAGLILSAPPSCVNEFMNALGLPREFSGYLRAALAAGVETGMLVALVGAGYMHADPGSTALLVVAPRPGGYSPGLPAAGIRLRIDGVNTVIIAARDAFTNEVLAAASRTGLENAKYIETLVDRLGGRDAAVYLPPNFYLVGGFLLRIHPAVLAAMLAQWLHRIEQSALAVILSSPLLAAAATTILAAAAYVAVARASGGLGSPAPEDAAKLSPTRPVEAIGATSAFLALSGRAGLPRLSRREAMHALSNLYRLVDEVFQARLGTSIEEALRSPERLQELPGMDPAARERALWALRRLHTLYTAKIENRRRLPIVISWRRELLRILDAIEPLLDALGAGLRGERGVERALLR